MENNAKLAIENQKTPNREICRSGRSFSTAFKASCEQKYLWEETTLWSEYLLPRRKGKLSATKQAEGNAEFQMLLQGELYF